MRSQFVPDGEITGLHGNRFPSTIGDCRISRVDFHNNSSGVPKTPQKRLIIRNVTVHECRHWACYARGAQFENVTVTDFRGEPRAPSYLWGCIFSQVTLRGRIGGLMFRWQVDPSNEKLSRKFLAANQDAYRSVDWALNISEAKFTHLEILLGVPAALVRRDPERHFLLRRSQALQLLRDTVEQSVWRISAQDLVYAQLEDTVIVTGGSGAELRTQIEQARELVDLGLLE